MSVSHTCARRSSEPSGSGWCQIQKCQNDLAMVRTNSRGNRAANSCDGDGTRWAPGIPPSGRQCWGSALRRQVWCCPFGTNWTGLVLYPGTKQAGFRLRLWHKIGRFGVVLWHKAGSFDAVPLAQSRQVCCCAFGTHWRVYLHASAKSWAQEQELLREDKPQQPSPHNPCSTLQRSICPQLPALCVSRFNKFRSLSLNQINE